MSLAGEDKLHGELLVVYNLGQTVEVGEEKVSALVCGESTCEANDEGVGVDAVENVNHSTGIALVGKPFFFEVATKEVDEFVFHRLSHVPDYLVGHVEDAFPCIGIALIFEHAAAESVVIEFLPLRSSPCGHVHTVGHIANVAFFPRVAFPYAGKHFLRYFAMEPAYAVGLLASIEGEHAH